MIKKTSLSLLGLLFLVTAFAQKTPLSNELILSKLDQYKRLYTSSILFAHIDKAIYTNNETIWFSAYLINETSESIKVHDVLSVLLIRSDNRKIILSDKYLMENGLSFGSLNLPDTILPGNHELLVSTNVIGKDGKPLCIFSQPVNIKSTTPKIFTAAIALTDTVKDEISIRFFPEGGNLVNGIDSWIGWEAKKNNQSLPVKLKGALYKDNKCIDTIETNDYGMGQFKLFPDSKSNYTLKIIGNNYPKQDTIYKLPKIAQSGINLHLTEAIVKDTLQINLFSKEEKDVQVFIHNYRDAYASFRIRALPSGKKVSIALPGLPKGIATVTVLDEQGRPLAERLFFAHYDHKITANLAMNKAHYGKKDSVKVKLKLTDNSGKPVQGLLSASIVQDNRLNSSNFPDIESFVYLYHELNSQPHYLFSEALQNKEYLENIMLIKGWRKYTWEALLNATGKDSISRHNLPAITAQVKYNGKPLKKPVEVIIQGTPGFSSLTTTNDGAFSLNRENLLIAADKKILLSVGLKNNEGYTINFIDPLALINQKLADQIEIQSTKLAKSGPTGTDHELAGLEHTQMLQTVNISASKGNDLIYGAKGSPGTNACGDYVDEFGYLNYPKSAGSNIYQPIAGKQYKIRTDIEDGASGKFTVSPIIYQGCTTKKNNTSFEISGIYVAREFYGANANNTEPQYVSTLLWKPGIITNPLGEAEISCLTGDITGKFRIIIQGITKNNVVFATTDFMVN